MGRVLALKVRTNAYNIMLANAKAGMKLTNPKNDTWILQAQLTMSRGRLARPSGWPSRPTSCCGGSWRITPALPGP